MNDGSQTDMMLYGSCGDLFDCGLADSARGCVDDAFNRFIVIGIYGEAEIRYRVFDFFSLVERQTAVDAIRDVPLPQRLLKHSRLCVCAVKYRELVIAFRASHLHL